MAVPAGWDNRPGLDVVSGLRAFAGGIGFVLTTPTVWPLALVPISIMAVVSFGLGALGIWGAWHTSEVVIGAPEHWWTYAGSWLVKLTLALLAIIVASIVALGIAQPLSGFALDGIAHAQERALTGVAVPRPGFITAVLRALRISAITVVIALICFGGLTLLGVLFPPALSVTVPLKFFISSWLLAWDFLDYPLGLHGLGFRSRLRWVRRNFVAFTAFGVAWAVCVIVPGIVLLLLPMGIAGATRLVVEASQNSGSR